MVWTLGALLPVPLWHAFFLGGQGKYVAVGWSETLILIVIPIIVIFLCNFIFFRLPDAMFQSKWNSGEQLWLTLKFVKRLVCCVNW